MKIIKTEIGRGQQSLDFKEIRESDEGRKIQIDIKSDSYDFQSHAKISVFNSTELKWNSLASIHYSLMKTPSKLSYKVPTSVTDKEVLSQHFKADVEELVSQAEALLEQNFSIKPAPKKSVKPK